MGPNVALAFPPAVVAILRPFMGTSTRTFALAAFLLATLSAVPALAQPRCAVLPFEGAGDVVLRRSFSRALSDNGFVTVIAEEEVDRAAAGGASPADVASATDARLVIAGNASGSRRSRRLEVVAYDASGRELARQVIRVRTGAAGRRALDQGVSELLAAALPAIGSDSGPVATSTEDEETESEEEAEEVDEEEEEEDEARPATPRPAGDLGVSPPIFVIRAGLVTRTRDAETLLLAGAPRSWRSSPVYIELAAAFELRPLAQSADLARGLFLRGEFAAAVGLGTRDTAGNDVTTEFFRAGGDVGYLLPVDRAVEVGLGVGFGWDAYKLGLNPNYPSIELPHVRPLLRGRIRAVDELVVVGLESGLRIVVDRGGLSSAFGGGDSIGFDLGANVSGTFDFGLSYIVDLSWSGVWHSFSGSGALGDGVSGVEQGFRVLVGAGYAVF